ncbi:MAG: histidine phosphatase family protein [Firmicutes bacterium]|nr:histidine phosphatase family protein [Bacillota bacterium]
MSTTIYIIRHGQTDLNLKRVLQGRSDMPMNETGQSQAKEAARLFQDRGIEFDMIWSSPLQRAVRTARIVAGEETPLQTDERLLEMDYGPYEGADLLSPSPEITRFFGDFIHEKAPEGMEPLDEVIRRMGEFLEDLKEESPAGNILLSTHAIAMKGALEYLTPEAKGKYWNTHIANCEVYVTQLEAGMFTVPRPLQEKNQK